METFDVVKTLEEHSHLITDVRFGPNSTMFATSSFDRNVKIWDAARPSESISKLEGHTEQVMSVDFHPRTINLLSSCDGNDEIRLWNVTQSTCTCIFPGVTKQVRFQPQFEKYLAAASGNSVNTFDVKTATYDLDSKGSGHAKDVLSICWDTTGKYLASVSEDSARIWSTASNGKCMYELQSNGNKFQSCTFHPGYSLLLIIGCYESLELWSPSESNKTDCSSAQGASCCTGGHPQRLIWLPLGAMIMSSNYGNEPFQCDSVHARIRKGWRNCKLGT